MPYTLGMSKDIIYTVTNVRDYCQVSVTTVNTWIRQGLLKSSILPNKRQQIKREDLVSFLTAYNLPIPAEIVLQNSL